MFKTTSANGFHMKFANGCTISVQWEYGNYCSDRDLTQPLRSLPREVSSVEVAAWDESGEWIRLPNSEDDVIGWQDADQVATIIAFVATYAPTPADDGE